MRFLMAAPDRIFRIDKVSQPDNSALAEEHVGIPFVETVVGYHPANKLAVGNSRGIFEW